MQMPNEVITLNKLLDEIKHAFPDVEMPRSEDLIFHDNECDSCREVRRYLNASRNMKVDSDLIRRMHQELYHLSPNALRWLLPHYLKFCISENGMRSQSEIHFLVFNLRPDVEFQEETKRRLSGLNESQITCLKHFLDWCDSKEELIEIKIDIVQANKFLNTIKSIKHV